VSAHLPLDPAARARARRRILIGPAAIATHALVLLVAITCVALGQWQLDRLAQVRSVNERLAARMVADPEPLTALLDGAAPDAIEFRRVTVAGTFAPAEEVLQRNRTLGGRQGFHVLTPLVLDDGRALLVRRGWVPARLSEPPVPEASPPTGRVELVGLIELPVPQPARGARDPEEGVLRRVFHSDVARLDGQVTGDLVPVVLRLTAAPLPLGGTPDRSPDGPDGPLPTILPLPTLDEANHRSYAVQWHVFAVIAVGAHLAALRTRLRRLDTAAVTP
jgi:surfeit locus 1 family protein